MTRTMHRSSDFITRAECQALIVHTLNQVFASLAEQPQDAVPEDQPQTQTLAPHTFTLGAPCA